LLTVSVQLPLMLQHLLHHQLHLIHAVLHELQTLIRRHASGIALTITLARLIVHHTLPLVTTHHGAGASHHSRAHHAPVHQLHLVFHGLPVIFEEALTLLR